MSSTVYATRRRRPITARTASAPWRARLLATQRDLPAHAVAVAIGLAGACALGGVVVLGPLITTRTGCHIVLVAAVACCGIAMVAALPVHTIAPHTPIARIPKAPPVGLAGSRRADRDLAPPTPPHAVVYRARPLVKSAGSARSVAIPRHAAGGAGRGAAAPPVGTPPSTGAAGDARRVAMEANPEGAIMHAPSVSVAAIRATLRAVGSPVLDATYADRKDAAEYIWDSGRVLGVDPAVVMSIFRHESLFGTRGMARQTLSVGNIRPLAGQPQLDGYRLYASWQQGIDDCYRLLRSYVRDGATTMPQAIPVWAPPTDNNDDGAYISSVMATMRDLWQASERAS